MSNFDYSELINTAIKYGAKILIALIILIVSFKIIDKLAKRFEMRLSNNAKVDKTLSKTLMSASKIGLKIVIVIALVGFLGIETSGISALVTSLGVCSGLAVNGTLSNLAGGVLLLITRPIKLGDYITAQGYDGTVESIGICYTKIVTFDNKVVYLPNSGLSTGTIMNYSEMKTRRVDFDFSVAGNDPHKVCEILKEVSNSSELILKDPAVFAGITDFGAGNGVKVTLRAWCKTEDYWTVYGYILEETEKKFAENNIVVPFNQLDVHIKQN